MVVMVFSLSFDSSAMQSEVEKATGLGGDVLSSLKKKEKKSVEQGLFLNEAFNQGLASFNPDLLYEHIVKSYSSAKNLLGPKLLRFLSGYSGSFLEKNIKIPEFRKELKNKIESNIDQLKQDGFLDKQGMINKQGVDLASVTLAVQELDKLAEIGLFGSKKKSFFGFGDVVDFRNFRKGDSYKDVEVRKSVLSAVRRSHLSLSFSDLKSKVRKSKSSLSVVYALDASASMRGEKIAMAKKAGIALSFKAVEEKDSVGLLVFNQDISKEIRPCSDFRFLLENIVCAKAVSQTNFALMLKKSVELFSEIKENKHLIVITDALPTVGMNPEKDALDAVSLAKSNEISVSLVGINLDDKGKAFAERIVEVGEGRLYLASNIDDLDLIVLEDYLSFA